MFISFSGIILYHKGLNGNPLLSSARIKLTLRPASANWILREVLCFPHPVPSSKDETRVFVGRNHHIKFNPPNPDSLNPVSRVYSCTCVCVRSTTSTRVYAHQRKDCAPRRVGFPKKKDGSRMKVRRNLSGCDR